MGTRRGLVEISQTRFPQAHTLLHLNKTETTLTSSTRKLSRQRGPPHLPAQHPDQHDLANLFLMSMIRFRGHVPKSGYDDPPKRDEAQPC